MEATRYYVATDTVRTNREAGHHTSNLTHLICDKSRKLTIPPQLRIALEESLLVLTLSSSDSPRYLANTRSSSVQVLAQHKKETDIGK